MLLLLLLLLLCPFLVDSGRMFSLVYSPWEGYKKSPQVPGLPFPSSYRDSTFLSIFAVPNNVVFWITSNLTFTPIRFMYSLKLTDSAPRTPITTGTTKTFCMCQTFAISSFNKWYFSNFSSSSSFTLATLIMTTSLSFLSIKTMSGLLEDQVYYLFLLVTLFSSNLGNLSPKIYTVCTIQRRAAQISSREYEWPNSQPSTGIYLEKLSPKEWKYSSNIQASH